jgi:cell wall-associated NlpC family hydrolase
MTAPNSPGMNQPGGPQTPLTGNAPQTGPNVTQAGYQALLNELYNTGKIATTALGINNSIVPPHSVTNTNLSSPPPMKTFVYSPEVRIVIANRLGIEFDISPDLVRCTLQQQENSAKSFSFTLQNKDKRYTPEIGNATIGGAGPFARMDRIAVYMKRTNWTQVFAGYLDSIPYKQLYPGEVTFTATCTLKRLMHNWFNPALQPSIQLLNQQNTPEVLGGDGQNGTDSGMGSIIRRLLVLVAGWPIAGIWIQQIPTVFLQFMQQQVAQSNQKTAPAVQQFMQSLTGSDTSPGPGAYAGSSPQAGQPGPTVGASGAFGWAGSAGTDVTTAFYVTQIVQACDNRGMGPSPSQNNLGAGLNQAGTTGATASAGSYGSQGDTKAWQQIQQLGANIQQANRNTDGAILGVACALTETGGGVTIRNLANPAVPDSLNFPNDGSGTNGTSCGIFQQQNTAQWGNVAQRMNPLQAAAMFFGGLTNVQGWQQMDAGQAIQQVQQSADGTGATYDAAMQLATKLVQAYRTGTSNAAGSGIPSASVGNLGSTVASAASVPQSAGAPSSIPGAVAGAASNGPTGPAVVPNTPGQPQPNSEGAINFCIQQAMGRPYAWGGVGPANYDCSGLVMSAFKSIGIMVPHSTTAISSGGVPSIPANAIQRGDLGEPDTGHVVIWMGDGTIIEAPDVGGVVQQVPNPYGPPTTWAWTGRVCQNGGINPAAPYNPPWTMGPGTPPSVTAQTGGTIGSGSSGSSDGIARNLVSYFFQGQAYAQSISEQMPADRQFLDGQPLLQIIRSICFSSLRSFSSSPNGDFMAWYPDYFGLDGKPAVLSLADIELKDLHIDFSDDPLTTHCFVSGDYSAVSDQAQVTGWLDTAGVVGVEQPWLYYRMIAAAPGDLDASITGQEIMSRFGIRPLKQLVPLAGSHELEFLMAVQMFMQKWAEQYMTQVTMTFMPEMFPGMRVSLSSHNLEVYVTQVTHVCDYARGFQTTASIMAPSAPRAKELMNAVTFATSDTGGLGGPGSPAAYLGAFIGPSIITMAGLHPPGLMSGPAL